jgi:phospholipid-translocating ATPase
MINLALLLLMCAICGVVDSILEHELYPKNAPWLYLDDQPGDNPSINGLITFIFAMITWVSMSFP